MRQNCELCGKELRENAKFCPYCGTKVAEVQKTDMAAQEPTMEPAMEPVQESIQPALETKQKKKISKKWFAIGGSGLVALALVITLLVTLLPAGGGKSDDGYDYHYYFYEKNDEIYYSDFNNTWMVSEELMGSGSFYISEYEFATLFRRSKDGTVLFYVDHGENGGLSLYYGAANAADKNAVLIDTGVTEYVINEDETLITYLKMEDNWLWSGSLWQYDKRNGTKEKIADDITDFYTSADGNTMIYSQFDDGLCWKQAGQEAELLDRNVSSYSVSQDGKTVFYINDDDELWRKTEGQSPNRITDRAKKILAVYNSGEAYYVKGFRTGTSYLDYLEDDMAQVDDELREWEGEAYEAKEFRDTVRWMFQSEMSFYSYQPLYYTNGSNEIVITEKYVDLGSNCFASEVPVFLFWEFSSFDAQKIKLSEISSYEEAREIIDDIDAYPLTYLSYHIAIGKTVSEIGVEDARYFTLSDDGKNLYFTASYKGEYNRYADLYQVSIENGTLSTPKLYDSDVYWEFIHPALETDLIYYKNLTDYYELIGDLYWNGQLIASATQLSDIDYYSFLYLENSGKLVYFTDYNEDEDTWTLNVSEKGTSTKIADQVSDFTVLPGGEILYLVDYNPYTRYEVLYLYRNGSSKKLDEGKIQLIPNLRVHLL